MIGIPYTRDGKDYAFRPKVLVGDAERQGVLEIDQNLFVNQIEPKKAGKDFSVVITKNNVSAGQYHYIEAISKNILQAGGSGKKVHTFSNSDIHGDLWRGGLNGLPRGSHVPLGRLRR